MRFPKLVISTFLTILIADVAFSQDPNPGTTTATVLSRASADQIAMVVLGASAFIVGGGLSVFYFKVRAEKYKWDEISVQTLGVIFFFPTLIVLGVYLELEKSAVTTILGAFIGYLFGRGGTGGRTGTPRETGDKTNANPNDPTTGGGGQNANPPADYRDDKPTI